MGPEGKEEQDSLEMQSSVSLRPTEAFPLVEPWPYLLPGLLGDGELEGFGSSLVNSSSED